jgi:hypothetical protein
MGGLHLDHLVLHGHDLGGLVLQVLLVVLCLVLLVQLQQQYNSSSNTG